MDRYCSTCSAKVVSSAVGYMCPECGQLHSFDKAQALLARPIPTLMGNNLDTTEIDEPVKTEIKPKTVSKDKPHKVAKTQPEPVQGGYSLKHAMKRLMVPELPAPHYSNQAVSAYGSSAAAVPPARSTASKAAVPAAVAVLATTAAAQPAQNFRRPESSLDAAYEEPNAYHAEDTQDQQNNSSVGLSAAHIVALVFATLLLVLAFVLALFFLR